MDSIDTPRMLEPKQVEEFASKPKTVVVDLCDAMTYRQNHVPHAVHLDYSRIVRHEPPIMGLLPNPTQFSQVIRELGISEDTHVIAYDDEGGGKASRLLWTLEAVGHRKLSLMNGGFHAWFGDRLPFDTKIESRHESDYNVTFKNTGVIADRDFILQNLQNKDVVVLDARTIEEYNAIVKRALRGGHVPGAVNFDWMHGLDFSRNKRMKRPDEILPMLKQIGVTPDKEIIVYCHTHHRSAYTYQMLKALGFERVRGYPGSWSDWGNHPGTPIEQ